MTESSKATGWPRRYGRYLVFEEFARGGMASVHLGRLVADRGFSRLVAVKMLSPNRAASSSSSSFYARALEDEARIASRVRHPNVVQPLDVVAERGDVLYVMEYVHGVSLGHLLDEARKNGETVPEGVTVSVMLDVLSALHAAHEAKDETGRPLGIIHRDVSPPNVLVGVDGLARLADFGVAKAMRREERTMTGAVKGKPAYMSPEQQRGLPLSRQADVFAAGVVLAVALTGSPQAPAEDALADAWLRDMVERIVDRGFREVVVTATKAQARDRYATAAEMAAALSSASASGRAPADAVGACVQELAGDVLEMRAELARQVESADANVEADADANANVDANVDANAKAMEFADTIADGNATLRLESRPPGSDATPPSAPTPPAARPFFSPGFLVLFTLSLVLGAVLVRSVILRMGAPSIQPPPAATSSAPLPASAMPSAAAPPVAALLSLPVPSLPAPSSSAPSTAPEQRSLRPARPLTAHPPSSPSPPTPPPVDCDPPFRIDAQGRKHYKPECVP